MSQASRRQRLGRIRGIPHAGSEKHAFHPRPLIFGMRDALFVAVIMANSTIGTGDSVLSGAFVVEGTGAYRVTAVRQHSFTARAAAFDPTGSQAVASASERRRVGVSGRLCPQC
jgi:hypothetical protein